MSRVMYDSVTVDQIPSDATAVAGYVDGNYRTFPALRRGWRKANKLSITVNSLQNAACLDVETGDAPVSQVIGWVRRQRQQTLNGRPVIYASRDTMPQVLDALRRAGIGRRDVRLWSAHYGIGPHVCSAVSCGAAFTADATQWTDKALGRNLDESLLADDFFPAKPARKRKLPAKPHPKVTAATVTAAVTGAVLGALHAAGIVHLTPTESSELTAASAGLAGYFFPAGKAT